MAKLYKSNLWQFFIFFINLILNILKYMIISTNSKKIKINKNLKLFQNIQSRLNMLKKINYETINIRTTVDKDTIDTSIGYN